MRKNIPIISIGLGDQTRLVEQVHASSNTKNDDQIGSLLTSITFVITFRLQIARECNYYILTLTCFSWPSVAIQIQNGQ